MTDTPKRAAQLIQKLKCFFGFHDLVVSEKEMEVLRKAAATPFGVLCGIDRMCDGRPVVFKVCTKCGAKK